MGDFSSFSCFLFVAVGVLAAVAFVRFTALMARMKIMEQQITNLQEQLQALRLSMFSRRPDPTQHAPLPLEPQLRDERVPEHKPPVHHPVPPPLPPQAVVHPQEAALQPVVRPPEPEAPAPLAEKIAAFTRIATPPAPTAPPASAPLAAPPAEAPPAAIPPIPHVRFIPASRPVPPVEAKPPKPAKPRKTLEQQVVRLIIGVSGIALALAAIYFVQLATQRGWLTAPMKLSAATGFGLLLLGAGQLKKFIPAPIRQPITGAGIVVLFAVITAGYHLYHILPTPVAFGMMVAVTAAAVALSLQQGVYVAALGLVGGFLTPALINDGGGNVPGLFAYLFVLQLGLMLVTRRRQWFILAVLTQAGCIAWILLVLGIAFSSGKVLPPEHVHAMGLFLLAMAGTTLLTTLSDSSEQAWGQTANPARTLSWVSISASILLSGVLVGVAKFDNMEWAFFGILAAATLVLARLRRVYVPMPWIAAGLTLVMLAAGVANERGWFADPFNTLNKLEADGPAVNILRYRILFTIFGALFSLGAYGCLWGSQFARRWMWLSVSAALAYMLAGYWLLDVVPHVRAWGWIPLAMAAVYGALSVPLFQRRQTDADLWECLSDLFVGLCGLVAIAAAMSLEQAWLTVGLAGLVPAYILLARLVKVPTPVTVGMMLSVVVLVRLMLNPQMLIALDVPMIQHPIVYGYGLTILFLGAAAGLLYWRPEIDLPRLQRTMNVAEGEMTLQPVYPAAHWGTLLHVELAGLILIWVTLLVRLWFHPHEVTEIGATTVELTTFGVAWLIVGWLLSRLPSPPAARIVEGIGRFAMLAGGAYVLVVLGVLVNPMLTGEAVGKSVIANSLLSMYGTPLLIVFCITLDLKYRRRNIDAAIGAVFWSIFLVLLTVTEIRQGFHGTILTDGATFLTEIGTYVVAFLLIAWGLIRLPQRVAMETNTRFGRGLLLTTAIASVIALGMIFNPCYTGDPVGATPIFNLLLFAYGLPALLLFGIALDSKIRSFRQEHQLLSVCWVLMLLLLVMLQIRQGFHGSLLREGPTFLAEAATYIVAALAIGWGLLRMPERLFVEVVGFIGWGLLALATAGAVIGLGLFDNPWLTGEDVGSVKIVNVLLYAYGAPLALIAAITFDIARRGRKIEGLIGFIAAILLLFALTTLQVRQAFHPDNLTAGDNTQAETYTYSAAWMVLSLALLTSGIACKSQVLRWASLVLMLLTIGKVFLDVFSLGGLIRVFSLLGLGVALLGIGWMYYKWVFRKPAGAEEAVDTTPG